MSRRKILNGIRPECEQLNGCTCTKQEKQTYIYDSALLLSLRHELPAVRLSSDVTTLVCVLNLRRHRGQRVRYARSACPVPYFHSHSAGRPLRGRSLTSAVDEDSVVQSTVSHVNVRQSGHDSLQELYQPISLVIGNRLRKSTHLQYRDKVLINPPIKSPSPSDRPIHFPDAPTVYVLNCGSIVKPHAFEPLKI